MRGTAVMILMAAVLLQPACSRAPSPAAAPAVAVAAQGCADPQAQQWYVPSAEALLPPPGELLPFPGFHALSTTSYVRQLRWVEGLPEPSFRCGLLPVQAYRFAWIPSFFSGITVRAQRNAAGQAWIIARAGPGLEPHLQPPPPPGVEDPDAIRWSCPPPRALSEREWASVVAAFAAMQGEDERFGLDGSTWAFESLRDGEQRLITRWEPRDPTFRNAGRLMMALAGCTDALQAMG